MSIVQDNVMSHCCSLVHLKVMESLYFFMYSFKMGQTLSEPVTAKDTSCCQDSSFRVGSSCMQGWRINMEDSHTHILSLPDDPNAAFFAVYDGHGGAEIADYAGKHLHKFVVKRQEYKDGDIPEAMRQAFLELDAHMLEEECIFSKPSGSTAITTLIKGDKLFCANVGDSRAVASVNGSARALSEDHKPSNQAEYDRIIAAGGWVDANRVNGNLALSRALGDFAFKKNGKMPAEQQIVTAFPDVTEHTITSDWEFIVLACDGIWDVMSNKEVVSFIRENIATGHEPEEICEELMMRCLAPDCQMAGLGCDNMTVVLVTFLHGESYEKLQEKCKQPPTEHVDAKDQDTDS
ncbi:probable protein phosphatase 2C T23F11.1 isoform X1 [Diabrotica virgifera virgifera]|uniref:protein-serine/threonine phosphatase n=2 Tax=Diabrotica virgifera virgifera TaxID=50390 RepID=A0A6P7FL96_DIAVI|nr:probable protein phosphatase 2C T23F11.1 isoform X1 [Diabrotica virgifera virgifera]